jgi:hypothetical protein
VPGFIFLKPESLLSKAVRKIMTDNERSEFRLFLLGHPKPGSPKVISVEHYCPRIVK